MKKFLFILCACLFGALSGVKAGTYVDPVNGRWYYLFNIGTSQAYFKGTSTSYSANTNILEATPVKVEESGSKHKLAFFDGGTMYRIYQWEGTGDPDHMSGVDFSFDGSATDRWGYRLTSNNGDWNEPDRYMTWNGTNLEFKKEKWNDIRDWQFIAYEEVLPSIVEAKAPTCASTAEASYVSGWERVTTKEQLAQNPERYFYAIFSAVNPGVMLETNTSGTYANRLCYRTAITPISGFTTLYELEGKGEFFAFKSCATGKYFANTSGAPWDYFADVSEYNANCQTTFSCNSGVWTIQAANTDETPWRDPVYHGNYAGSWDNYEYIGERLAANKSIERAGYFLIYRILKKNLDMTGRITNPSFEAEDMSAWSCNTANDTGRRSKTQNDNRYNMSSIDGDYLFNTWDNGSASQVSQTLYNMPSGFYTLTAVMASDNNETLQLKVGDGVIATSTATGAGNGIETSGSFSFSGGNMTISADAKGHWYKADNFRLTYLGEPATDADYTALQNAINNADAKVLGFDDGEYAPYNNVAVLNALADAKAIDPSADNLQIDVQNATAAIANENWTVNSGEVNAIYNPTFALSDNNGAMAGWENSNAEAGLGGELHSRAFVLHSGDEHYSHLAPFNQGDDVRSAAYLRFDSYNSGRGAVYTYGGTSDYPMPLKASTYYNVKFDMGSWNQPNKAIKLTVVDGAGTEVASQTKSTIGSFHDDSGTLVSFDLVFLAEEEGNYKIKISNPNDVDNAIVVSNFELKRYNGMIEDDDTNTQVYYGTFKSRVDLTPTDEHPFVDITHASFDGDVFVNLDDNPNGLVYATPSQVSSIKSSYGTTKAIPNVVSNYDNVCESLVIYDGHPFFVPSHSNIRATEATYSRDIVATSNFGTICLPFAVKSNEKIQYYTVTQITGDVLRLETAEEVEAGVPAIFKKKDSEATEITAAANNVAITNNAGDAGTSVKLVGTFTKIVVGDKGSTSDTKLNQYYIKNNQFCQGVDYFNVGAFRAYLDAEGSSHARLSLQIDDETTAINELKTLDEKQGLKDGKYLIGGKIIVVKDGKQFNVNGVLK